PVSMTVPRRWRLRLPVLWLSRCFLPAWRRFSLPLAVTRKRFLAPLWVFIFGMFQSFQSAFTLASKRKRAPGKYAGVPECLGLAPPLGGEIIAKTAGPCRGKTATSRLRRQHRRHASALHRRRPLDLGDVGQFQEHAVDDALALLDVLQLAAAEEHV